MIKSKIQSIKSNDLIKSEIKGYNIIHPPYHFTLLTITMKKDNRFIPW